MNEKRKIRCSVSVEGYENKKVAKDCVSNGETVREGKRAVTKFREMEMDVDEFIELATSGHTFCGLFKHKKGINFTAKTKTAKNYIGSQLVFVDIDKTRYESMEDFIDVLSYPPAIGYYSFSDGKEGSRHFRLVYVLDGVYDWATIREVYLNIKTQTEYDTDEKIKDNCGGSFVQCFFGTCYKDVWKDVNNIYSPEDIELVGCELPQEGVKQAIREPIHAIDKDFIRDIKRMSYNQFVYNYYHEKGYRNYWQTEYRSNRSFWSYTDDNFVKLYQNMEVIRDGHKRRKKLYQRMCLRRLMKPEATIEEILYCAYIDREQFIDNSDEVVSIDCLVRNAKNAFKMSLGQIRKKYQSSIDYCRENRPKSVINADVVNKRAMVPVMIKERKDAEIGGVYDMSKSFTDNLADCLANGIKVSERRLKKWCKENGVAVERKRSERQKRNDELAGMYDLGKGLEENAVALGISVSKAHRIKAQRVAL